MGDNLIDGNRRLGDFSGLALDYAENRPDYSDQVLKAITGLLSKPLVECDFADVGAGTGIWTRMVSNLRPRSTIAIEPNSDMRRMGTSFQTGQVIDWRDGTAENTGLTDCSVDFLSMASSFHWADFELAIGEFWRVLRPEGMFVAIWNPRYIEPGSLLAGIEDYLYSLKPDLQRVSSGRSGFTANLEDRVRLSGRFTDVVFMESKHEIKMSPARYLGAWRSVSDVRVQLGPVGFNEFLAVVEERTRDLEYVPAVYQTRAWVARRVS